MIFGLYHGLMLLPVLLIIGGPNSDVEQDNNNDVPHVPNFGSHGHDNMVFAPENIHKTSNLQHHAWR